jgi:ABC-type nitrate/sulfonate/bicarbonate transport system substrate-binding protein
MVTRMSGSKRNRTPVLARKLMIAAAAVVLAVSAVAACSSSGGGSKTDSGAKSGGSSVPMTKVDVGYFPGVVQTFLFDVAKKEGFFAKRGLDANLVSIQSGPNLVTAITTGSVDFADVGLAIIGPLMTQQNQKLKVLTGNFQMNYAVVGQPTISCPEADQAFPAPIKCLKGKKVAVNAAGSVPEDMLKRLLAAAGMTLSDVQEVFVGGAAGTVAAFGAKQVDYAVTYPPINQEIGTPDKSYTTLVDAPTGKNVGNIFDGYIFDVYAAMSPWVDSHRAQATGFCNAINDSYQWAMNAANAKQLADLLSDWVNISPASAAQAWNQAKDTFKLKMTQDRWNAASKFGGFSGDSGGGYSQYVDSACVNAISS